MKRGKAQLFASVLSRLLMPASKLMIDRSGQTFLLIA
jgi:hypothetical protein